VVKPGAGNAAAEMEDARGWGNNKILGIDDFTVFLQVFSLNWP
jgi:hypothetical protein